LKTEQRPIVYASGYRINKRGWHRDELLFLAGKN
jgi:hypothetical protein